MNFTVYINKSFYYVDLMWTKILSHMPKLNVHATSQSFRK